MPHTPYRDQLVANNNEFAAEFAHGAMSSRPARHVAVVTCMDCRIDVSSMLGLKCGEAHVLRNAGGIVTDDVIRSLTLSQRALGTKEIVVIHHTQCGVQGIDEGEFRATLERDVGVTPSWSVETFEDAFHDVRQSMQRLRLSPFLPETEHISGFVYDVADGRLITVDESG